MIDRLVENWLINATEKSFQIPFCYMLANEGYTILHLTRHCGMEHGKDIIALDPDGNPHVYQLKGAPQGKIKLRQWQKELIGQTNQLTITPVTHPSIPPNTSHHLSFLVTNGEIEEEVSYAIDAQNKRHISNGQPGLVLNTIVKGQLIEKAKKLGQSFLPPEIADFKELMDFYLSAGFGILNKAKFAGLIESFFSKEHNKAQRLNHIRGGALLVSLATSSYSNKQNHIAIVEAWIIYISYLFRYCEIHKIPEKDWSNELGIAKQIIWTSLENLWKEVKDKPHLLLGNYTEDVFVERFRRTWLIGFLSALGIHYKMSESNQDEMYEIQSFCNKSEKKIDIWGESGVSSALVYHWFYSLNDASEKPLRFLLRIINTIINRVLPLNEVHPEVYYDIDESISVFYEKDDKIKAVKNEKGSSHYLEGLVHIFVNYNYLQHMKVIWPEVSRIVFKKFCFNRRTDFYKWLNLKGREKNKVIEPTKSWKELKQEASECDGKVIPKLFKENPELLIIFLIVYPHRGDPSVLRWLDAYLYQNIR